jgi:elongation factor G
VKKILTGITIPPKVLALSIKPKENLEINDLIEELRDLAREDPSFSYEYNADQKSIIIYGMGELHLDVKVTLLAEKGIRVEVGKPMVQYRETIKLPKPVIFTYEHKKQTGGKGQYAKIDLKIESMEDFNNPIKFGTHIFGAVVREAFFKEIQEGVDEASRTGPQTKSPVTGISVTLVDGKEHPVDSDAISFYLAGRYAMVDFYKECLAKGQMELLEPMVSLEITNLTEENIGAVAGLVSSRGGVITDQTQDVGYGGIILRAEMPLENTLGLITQLRACTKGLATYTQENNGYRKVSPDRAQSICTARGTSNNIN